MSSLMSCSGRKGQNSPFRVELPFVGITNDNAVFPRFQRKAGQLAAQRASKQRFRVGGFCGITVDEKFHLLFLLSKILQRTCFTFSGYTIQQEYIYHWNFCLQNPHRFRFALVPTSAQTKKSPHTGGQINPTIHIKSYTTASNA